MTKPKKQTAAAKAAAVRKKAKRGASVSVGKVYITATFNNTKVYIADQDGNTLAWSTAGARGFKGSRKSTPFAAQEAARAAAEAASACGLKTVSIIINGPGPGREAAAKAMGIFFKVKEIHDVTGIPHNGCRAEKERRV